MIALVREVPAAIERGERSHVERTPIDLADARRQHAAYVAALADLGCTIEELPPLDDQADSVFVEDTAVVVDELAVVTRPGAESRRGETESTAAALARHRPLAHIEAPATLDGGDVLRVGRRLWVGLSARSDERAVAQLARLLAPHGYSVTGVAVRGALHLKTAVTQVAPDLLVVNPEWVDLAPFAPLATVAVDPSEPMGANALVVGTTTLYPTEHRRTAEMLERLLPAHGSTLRTVEAGELAKAEGGLTCCSILLG